MSASKESDKKRNSDSNATKQKSDWLVNPGINPDQIEAVMGRKSTKKGIEYLDVNRKGKGIWDYGFTSIGLCYLTAGLAGCLKGIRDGIKKSPSDKWQIKLNSVLNHSGKWGSRYGNIAGCVSITYVLSDFLIEKSGANDILGRYRGYAASGAAGVLTGSCFMPMGSAARSRVLAGSCGGVIGMLFHIAFAVWTHQAA